MKQSKKVNGVRVSFKLFLIMVSILNSCRFSRDRNINVPQTASQGRDFTHSLNVNGLKRNYTVHVPPGFDQGQSLPLVIVLHGGGGNAQNVMEMTGMNGKADQADFVVAYPNGSGRTSDRQLTWNAGNCCGFARDRNIDDVNFIRSMIDAIQEEYQIDPRRIYATGFSNGAMMVYRLGCEMSEILAGIAPVSGALNLETCQPVNPISVMIFHGKADEHILYEGGSPKLQIDEHARVDKPVAYSVNFWVELNDCSPVPNHKESGNIVIDSYTPGCAQDTEVILYTVLGGGHAWPGGKNEARWRDEPSQEISATDLMWEFFARHSR